MFYYYNKKANKFGSSYKDTEAMADLLCPLLNLCKWRSEETIRGAKKSQKKGLETTTQPITIAGDLIIADTKATSDAAINITSEVRNIFPKFIIKSAQDAATNTPDTTDSTAATDTAATNDKYEYTLQDIIAEIKSLKINKNEGVKDEDVELEIKLVKKPLKMRCR